MSEEKSVKIDLREAGTIIETRSRSVTKLLGPNVHSEIMDELVATRLVLHTICDIEDMCYTARKIAEDEILRLETEALQEQKEEDEV